jgi:polysaccharide deacetylase 2 family uncharacterized protein YibQ
MVASRRARSRRVALEAARRQMGSWRANGRGGGPGRAAGLMLAAVALIGVGFLLGRWSAGRAAPVDGDGVGAALAAAPVALTNTGPRPAPASGEESGLSSVYAEPDVAAAPADAVDRPLIPPEPIELPVAAPNAGPVAIVIDDLGRSVEVIDVLRALGVPITYAVLPYETKTAAVVARLAELGEEVLCHLPMEPQSSENPGPGALTEGMSRDELREATRNALAAVPAAVGVNNHMGSALSADHEAMTAVIGVVRRRNLFFLDSRTSAASVGYAVAREAGIPAAERKVFLDRDRDPAAIRGELRRLLELANKGEPAIAIGHPYPETIAVLQESMPRAKEGGFRFVRVSEVLVAPRDLSGGADEGSP